MDKLYLGEILKVDNYDVLELSKDKNVLIVAPTGAGKSYFIKNDLFTDDKKKYLILVDNTGVKMQTMKGGDICNSKGEILVKNEEGKYELTIEYFGRRNITVMCYEEFGRKVRYDFEKEFVQSFDVIVADEIHNIVNYQEIEDSANLLQAFIHLLDKYDKTKIVWLTATPYYLDKLAEEHEKIDKNFITINYYKDKRIRQYVQKRKTYLKHFSSIITELRQYKDFFEKGNGKVLIFTRKISNMRLIQEALEQLDFINPICIWSDNNKINKLSDEQIKVRDYLIDVGYLLEGYNCLIINKAYETGINIFDPDMQIMVAHTTNVTEQVQSAGRIRHDIDLLVLRTNDTKLINKIKIEIDEDLLNKWLDKEDIQIFIINKFNLKDNKGRDMTVNKLLNEINQYGYIIKKSTNNVNNKRVVQYMITKI